MQSSAEDLVDTLRARHSTLPRAPDYNVLNDLADHGLAMRVDAGPGRALYEAASTWRHHLCQCILDVPCAVGSKPCVMPEIEGLVVDEAQVIFRGLCPFACENPSVQLGLKPACCES